MELIHAIGDWFAKPVSYGFLIAFYIITWIIEGIWPNCSHWNRIRDKCRYK